MRLKEIFTCINVLNPLDVVTWSCSNILKSIWPQNASQAARLEIWSRSDWHNFNSLHVNTIKKNYRVDSKISVGTSFRWNWSLNPLHVSRGLNMRMENSTLDSASQFNYRGVTINSALTWHDHLAKLTSKINLRLGSVAETDKALLLHQARLIFYNSLVLPLFD